MEYLLIVAGAVLAVFLISAAAKRAVRRVTIMEYETGLKYSRGKFQSTLEPGQY
ncbi:MAG: hypothetical protein QGG73_12785 [Candidatus Hydrogenedentes bacterium]|jgi:hypothetical protein|nr:hypothetical protein [Candidatus Hydrogenedentota bacterium]